jgi:hypothetical protein
MSYSEWLRAQTPERQAASLANLKVCIALGEAQRTAPYSEEAARLTAEVRKYYETEEN